jgi:CTP:molybdopterin cytidylyltransferase MocA
LSGQGSGGATGDPATGAPPTVDMIVVAAGRSMRMHGRDKLAVEVAGRPLLAWTLGACGDRP